MITYQENFIVEILAFSVTKPEYWYPLLCPRKLGFQGHRFLNCYFKERLCWLRRNSVLTADICMAFFRNTNKSQNLTYSPPFNPTYVVPGDMVLNRLVSVNLFKDVCKMKGVCTQCSTVVVGLYRILYFPWPPVSTDPEFSFY